jgi:hypothetical protein
MKLRKVVVTSIVCLMFFAISAHSSILMNETFSYADGSLTNVASSVWSTFSGTTGSIQVSNGQAIVVGSTGASEDSSRLINGSSFGAGTDLYVSLQLTMTVIPSSTTGSEYIFGLTTSGNASFVERLFPKKITSTTYELGVANSGANLGTAGAATFTASDLSLNTTYTVVLKYHNDATAANITTSLWINPTQESDTHVIATDTGNTTTLARIFLRQPSAATIGTMKIDNILVGTTFANVVNAIPEPSTMALVGLGLVPLFFRRRR